MHSNNAERVVIDVETTGLSRQREVVEIALIVLDACNEPIDRFESLVRPRRSFGASNIHLISKGELQFAPTFEQISARVLQMMEGRIPIAHNLSFDWSTLSLEFERMGMVFASQPKGWCTANLATEVVGASRRKAMVKGRKMSLAAACSAYGISNLSPHRASSDADASARLFVEISQRCSLPAARPIGHQVWAWKLPPAVDPHPRAKVANR